MYKLVKIEGSVKVLNTLPEIDKQKKDEKPALHDLNQRLCVVRGQKVMLDIDAAAMYGTDTAELLRKVSRNKMRFPADYMFRLTRQEYDSLLSQSQSLRAAGRQKFAPLAFTERGVVMLSMVLETCRAAERAFEVIENFVKNSGVTASAEKKFGPAEDVNPYKEH
ncbi:MAG TPA: ORF6N domain-containing protein [Candidatus Goldiibacteriota bacterium]|nr:ORF6N domain-containing protein [Candidatus Goldiibacteriota bacterium]